MVLQPLKGGSSSSQYEISAREPGPQNRARMNERKYFLGLIRTLKVTHSALDPAEFIFIHGQPALSSSPGTSLTDSSKTTVYPNPADREVNLKLGGDQDDSDVVITVTDLSGRIVLTRKAEGDRNDVMTIDISGIAEGIYLVQISSGPHSGYMKLLVAH